ncbi:MAG TPA: hypothetical protein VK137_14505, partial [Planctomycetaceae bacterium]|nr:hypothetical protein [Planctomycetaceae bacterium]
WQARCAGVTVPAGNHAASAVCMIHSFSCCFSTWSCASFFQPVTVRYRNQFEEAADGGWFEG